MTPEGKLQKKVVKWASTQGVAAIRLSFQRGVVAGWPDMLFLIPGGQAVFIEFKQPGKKPSDLQKHKLKVLNELGFTATWCDTFDKARAVIAQALDTGGLHAPGSGAP